MRWKSAIQRGFHLVLLLLLSIVFLLCIGCGGEEEEKPQDVPQEKIILILRETALELKIGDTHLIKADCTPNKEMIWESSNPSVVSVDNGKVTAHQVGRAVITVRCETESKNCTVAVTKKEPTLTVSAPGCTLTEGERTVVPYVYESEEKKTVVFTAFNPEIASVSETGEVTAHKAGETEIQVEADGLCAFFRVTVLPQPNFVFLS